MKMKMKEENLLGETALPYKRMYLLGKEALIFREVTSTNTVAMQLARFGASENIIVMSSSQKDGQGRLGRSWFCPAGQGLMLSMILRPDIEWHLIPQLTLLCGAAVAETVKKITGCEAGIKWPNDIVLNGKKICGILAQSSFTKSGPGVVVLGFGLNVNLDSRELPPDCRETATSLKQETGLKFSRLQILKQFILVWNEHYQKFLLEGYTYLRQKWLENNVTLGRTVWINKEFNTQNSQKNKNDDEEGLQQGVAVDLSERGGLIIRFADGGEEEFMAGDLSLGRSHYGRYDNNAGDSGR